MAPAASTRWSNGQVGLAVDARRVRASQSTPVTRPCRNRTFGWRWNRPRTTWATSAAFRPGRGHLVQQRLEGVEVVLVDEGDLDRRALQAPGDLEPAEPGADHHDLAGPLPWSQPTHRL